MNIDKFSLLMANYNNGKYIDEAIESVLRQTYRNWELIIIDDASTDNSIEVISRYVNDKRIKLIKNNKNLGVGGTKRKCAFYATGKYIGILDPDDILDSEAIEIIIKEFGKKKYYGCIYTTHYQCDFKLKVLGINKWAGEIKNGSSNLQSSKTTAFLAFTKEVYDLTTGFDDFFKKAADKDLIYKLEEVTRLKFINKPLYYYRMHSNSISLGKNEQKASAYQALARYNAYKRRLGTNIPNLTKEQIANQLLLASFKFLFYFEFSLFFLSLIKSVQTKPINFFGYMVVFKKILQELKHRLWILRNG